MKYSDNNRSPGIHPGDRLCIMQERRGLRFPLIERLRFPVYTGRWNSAESPCIRLAHAVYSATIAASIAR